ncbi:hypothetical protein [Dipodfec virus UA06Rod_3]|uniref:Uncharacterized protein n=1 Tax=Dipodfec virus UA06Rod_3 TaxID=2929323 RepID=A0A976N280_9VIRU|nr:hypothetical protein [Dipodfec virus UA06Rod_3]
MEYQQNNDKKIYVVSYKDKEFGVNKFFDCHRDACSFAMSVEPPIAISIVPTFEPINNSADCVVTEVVK